jgi:GNAT superfamily N-acetyltransferase
MAWTLTEDLDEYLTAAGDFLRAQPVRHTIELTAIEGLRAHGSAAPGPAAPLYGWWRPGAGSVAAGLLHTPPFPALLTPLPAGATPPLARALRERGRELPGVSAEQGDSARFAAAWGEVTGASARIQRRTRLFRLGTLTPPDLAPPGAARRAGPADRGPLTRWLTDFGTETGEEEPWAEEVADRLSHGGLAVWQDGGQVVSLAGASRPAAGMVRVGPVYTPPGLRRRGYGAAVTVAVTQAALDAGAQSVVLFTSLASPARHALYPRLGFRAVADRTVLEFTP